MAARGIGRKAARATALLAAAVMLAPVAGRAQHGVASCSADGRTWDDTCSGGARASRHYAPPIDPNEEAAWSYNSIGNQAFNAGRYDEAIAYYEKALQRMENAAIRQNLRQAQVQRLFALTDAEWQNRNWKTVIALLTEAYNINYDQWIARNIQKARAYQSADWAQQAWDRKDYNQAIVFWQQANQLAPSPSYLENIELARQALLGRQVVGAYKSGDYGRSMAAAKQRLATNPNDEWAAVWLAEASLEHKAASFGELQSQFDDAVMALLRISRSKPGDQKLANSLTRVRAQAFFALTRYTSEHSVPGGWDRAVQSLERWGVSHDSALSFLQRATGGQALGMGTWGPAISAEQAGAAAAAPVRAPGAAPPGTAAPAAGSASGTPSPAEILRVRRDAVIAAAAGDPDAAAAEQARLAFEQQSPGWKFHKTETPRPDSPRPDVSQLAQTLRSAEIELEAIPNPDTIRDLNKRGETVRKKEAAASKIKALKQQIFVLTEDDDAKKK
jgi:tetratricopeptide (TPR) repeat protein